MPGHWRRQRPASSGIRFSNRTTRRPRSHERRLERVSRIGVAGFRHSRPRGTNRG
uniref:hypothetical protein n=1 Tax=Microcella putealis TaxID=337005 RepID=UPI00102AF23B